MMIELVPGVSRNTFRDHDAQAQVADAEYRAKRPAALQRAGFICQGCGVKSVDGMEVHHRDCNHANNSDENLTPECVLCHPINHIGELASRVTRVDDSELAGGMSNFVYLPDISQQDLSHLMRTIGHVLGAADASEQQKADAKALHESLLPYSQYIEGAWGSSRVAHFAIALKEVAQPQYERRADPMQGLRVVFALGVVVKLARKFVAEFVSLPFDAWPSITARRLGSRQGQ
jgi:intracellular multiplication protein IcmJ